MSRSVLIALAIFQALNLASGERVKYDNFHVYKVTPKSKDQVKFLGYAEEETNSAIYLNTVHRLGKSMYIAVPPEKCKDFQLTLNRSGIELELVHENLQQRLDDEIKVIPDTSREYNWKQYHTLDETYSWLDSLPSRFPEHVKIIIGGSTYEKREIKGVKISFKAGNKGIFLEGGSHGREWISPATVTYILNQLLTSRDPCVKKIARSYDWYIFPHINPDGYVYTHTTDRLWRKTRSPNTGINCTGTDPSRNWDFHWAETNNYTYPCSSLYTGKEAFSEIEVRSLAEYIESLKGKIHIYLSFESYGQQLRFPYGYTGDQVPKYRDLKQIGDVAAKSLALSKGTAYEVGSIYELVYPYSGSSIDWAYGKAKISLSYQYYLRPAGDDWAGVLISADYIIPTGEETLDSIVALVRAAKSLGSL